MKIISKEEAWFGYKNYKIYCFKEINDNYRYSPYNYYKFLSDITVNEYNEIHSYNDQPLIYKDGLNRLCKAWFINGENRRLNTEKPKTIVKGYAYFFNDGRYMSIRKLKDNLK